MTAPEHNDSSNFQLPVAPNFDIEERMRTFIGRAEALVKFAERELGAFTLFNHVASATEKIGKSSTTYETGRYGRNSIDVLYYPISYQADLSDSSTRREIQLRRTTFLDNGEVVSVLPWLRVFTLDAIAECGFDGDAAEYNIMRLPLEAACGYEECREEALFDPVFDYLNKNTNGTTFETLLKEQRDYIGWLTIAATALDIPSHVYTSFQTPTDFSTS